MRKLFFFLFFIAFISGCLTVDVKGFKAEGVASGNSTDSSGQSSTGDTSQASGTSTPTAPSFQNIVMQFQEQNYNCVLCHGAAGDLDLSPSAAYKAIVMDNAKEAMTGSVKRINKDNPELSLIVVDGMENPPSPASHQAPQTGENWRLWKKTDPIYNELIEWIKQGAKP